MIRSLAVACTVALGLAAPLGAQDSRPGIAVVPFDDGGSYGQDKENFAALQVGIPAILTAELAKNPAVRLVDRSRTQDVLGEQDLGARGRLDAATAAKVGKLVGARYMIMGSFIDFYGKFRVNARIVDVETGEILTVVSNDDPKLQDRNDLFRIIQHVGGKIMEGVKLPPLPSPGATAIPTEALTFYSRALLYQDRGDRAKATEYYQRALQAYPEFAEAKEGLRKVSPS